MLKQNSLKNKLLEKKQVVGTWSSLSSPNVVDVLGSTDLDFVVIDMEQTFEGHITSKVEKANGIMELLCNYLEMIQHFRL